MEPGLSDLQDGETVNTKLSDLRAWIEENGLDEGQALEELARWDRKHYTFEITTSGHVQPGDGVFVALYGGGRRVSVNECDYEGHDPNIPAPTIGELILAAICEWHADQSPKNYRAIAHWSPDRPTPEPTLSLEKIARWSWSYRTTRYGSIEYWLTAPNEYEATRILKAACPDYPGDFDIWEVSPDWCH